MADDIRPGDVVVCVDESPCKCCDAAYPYCIGQMFRVTRVEPAVTRRGVRVIALYWDGSPGFGAHLPDSPSNADRFRKLPTADTEFTAQMRALKPRQHSKQEA